MWSLEPTLQVSGSQTSGNIRVMGELVESTLGSNDLRDPEATFRKRSLQLEGCTMHFER